MANLNRVLIIGNLTRDPDTRYTPNGTAVTDIGIAVDRKWTEEGGEKKEEVTFIDVTMFGRNAEVAQQYLKKGASVFVEGRLKLDSWSDKQTGEKRSRLRVVAEHMQMLGGGQRPEGSSQQPQRRAAAPPARATAAAGKSRPDPDPDFDPDFQGEPPF